MECVECGKFDGHQDLDDLPAADVIRLCREWVCAGCSRTDEQVQADFSKAAAAVTRRHVSAHDWESLSARRGAAR